MTSSSLRLLSLTALSTALPLLGACGANPDVAPSPVESSSPADAGELRDQPRPRSSIELSLPRPTGTLPVGARSTFVTDPSRIDVETGRSRVLPVRVFYPARDVRGSRPARYLSPVIQPLAEEGFGLPPGALGLDPHAFESPPMSRQLRGVILVSPAYQLPVAFETAQVIELASRGWALVTFDHPHETAVAEQPGGTFVEGTRDRDRSFSERVLDVRLVLDRLSTLIPDWHAGIPVGMFGHSLGGSAAAEAVFLYPELRAGVDLDGTPRGGVVEAGLDKPFGVMLSNLRVVENVDDGMEAWITRLRGPHPVSRLYSVYHDGGFNDFVVFNRQATAFDPALGATLEGLLPTHVDDLDTATAAITAQRRFLANFMQRYVDCGGGR